MEVKKGYKQTEIGIIPEDWEIESLKNISSIHGRIGWQGLTQAEFTMNHDEPFLITGMNFKDGEIKWDEVYHISLKRYEIAKEIQLKINDILMTKDGTIGKLLFVNKIPYPGKASLNSHLLVFRPLRNKYVPKFLYYQFDSNSFKKYIDLNKSGSTFFGISQEAIENYKAFLPSLQEQTAIANVLSDIDALIESIEKLITKKRNIKQGAMQQLLTGKKRLPGFGGEWELKTIMELTNCLDHLRIPLNDNQRLNMKGDYPYCGANGVLDYIDQYLIDDDIILIAEDGGYFDEYNHRPIAYRMKGKCWVNNHAHILKAKDGYYQDYIFYSLVHKNILNFLTGGTRAKLNKSEMYKIEIFIPSSFEEQTAIAEVLSDMDSEIEALEKKLNKYKKVKQGMMQELLTGKKRLI